MNRNLQMGYTSRFLRFMTRLYQIEVSINHFLKAKISKVNLTMKQYPSCRIFGKIKRDQLH